MPTDREPATREPPSLIDWVVIGISPALIMLMVGSLVFFLVEKLVLWHHWHDDEACEVHKSTAALLIVGDAIHTFVDGVAMGHDFDDFTVDSGFGGWAAAGGGGGRFEMYDINLA